MKVFEGEDLLAVILSIWVASQKNFVKYESGWWLRSHLIAEEKLDQLVRFIKKNHYIDEINSKQMC